MPKIFRTSITQVLTGIVLISTTFIITYYVDIVDKITGQSNINETVLRQTLGDQISSFTGIGTVNTIVIVIFWSMVGLIAYTAVWSMASGYISARNGVKVEKEYTNRGRINDRLRVPLIRLGIIVGIAIAAAITLEALWPYWLGLFGQFLSMVGDNPVTGLFYLVAAYIGALLNLYVLKVGVSAVRSL